MGGWPLTLCRERLGQTINLHKITEITFTDRIVKKIAGNKIWLGILGFTISLSSSIHTTERT